MTITYIEPQAMAPEAVIHNGLVYISGQVAFNQEGQGFVEQTNDVLELLERVLNVSGSSKAHLLSLTIYLTAMDQYNTFNEIYDTWLKGLNKPARTCVKVEFPYEGYLLEISAIAAVKS